MAIWDLRDLGSVVTNPETHPRMRSIYAGPSASGLASLVAKEAINEAIEVRDGDPLVQNAEHLVRSSVSMR